MAGYKNPIWKSGKIAAAAYDTGKTAGAKSAKYKNPIYKTGKAAAAAYDTGETGKSTTMKSPAPKMAGAASDRQQLDAAKTRQKRYGGTYEESFKYVQQAAKSTRVQTPTRKRKKTYARGAKRGRAY